MLNAMVAVEKNNRFISANVTGTVDPSLHERKRSSRFLQVPQDKIVKLKNDFSLFFR